MVKSWPGQFSSIFYISLISNICNLHSTREIYSHHTVSGKICTLKFRSRPINTVCLPFKGTVRGASKIKLKNVNEKRMATARRLIFFWNFSRHPLLIWLHYCFHHCKTLKAVATAIVVLTPANFYHFRRPKFNFQPLSFTCRTKNCC
jgi:hypothetical protein